MKIKIWNAFASNNSGSYTIVGSFREPGVAEQVARELADLCAAHTKWYGSQTSLNDGAGSPLHEFILRNGLKWEARRGASDDWPQEYGPPPTVGAVGHQVIVHVPYTITMPPTFGELMYARGGRVDVEIDHAHDPIVSQITLWWPYQWSDADREAAELAVIADLPKDEAIKAALAHVDGVAENPICDDALLWCRGETSHRQPVMVGALFDDVVRGVQAVAALGARHGASHQVKLIEALTPDAPLGYLKAP